MVKFEYDYKTYIVANPYDAEYDMTGRSRYPYAVLITVGIYASDNIIVFTDKPCDLCDIMTVLETALDALPDKGWDCSDQVNEAYEDALASGMSHEEAADASIEDVTLINGGSHYIAEWGCSNAHDELGGLARQHSLAVIDD